MGLLVDHLVDLLVVDKFGTYLGKITDQRYGKEVAITGVATVCWHFVE